jgi:hypothetical protein
MSHRIRTISPVPPRRKVRLLKLWTLSKVTPLGSTGFSGRLDSIHFASSWLDFCPLGYTQVIMKDHKPNSYRSQRERPGEQTLRQAEMVRD